MRPKAGVRASLQTLSDHNYFARVGRVREMEACGDVGGGVSAGGVGARVVALQESTVATPVLPAVDPARTGQDFLPPCGDAGELNRDRVNRLSRILRHLQVLLVQFEFFLCLGTSREKMGNSLQSKVVNMHRMDYAQC